MRYNNEENDYDNEPVKYCSRCYSLKIGYESVVDAECCMECGCSDILESPIEEWEKLFERRYGHKYVVKGTDIKKSPIFSFPISRLKKMVWEHPQWMSIIHSLYPRFPHKLSKEDSIILLFDKLTKDNKIDDLRITLLNYKIKNNHGRE